MNKLIKMAVIAVGAAAMFAGCSKGPDEVALKFVESFGNGDVETACKYATKQTGALLALAKGMAENDSDMKKMKGAKFEVVETKIDGDSATVKIKTTTKDGKVDEGDPVTLIKEDGDWKVNVKKEN